MENIQVLTQCLTNFLLLTLGEVIVVKLYANQIIYHQDDKCKIAYN